MWTRVSEEYSFLIPHTELISCLYLGSGQSQVVIIINIKPHCVYSQHSVASPSRRVYTLASEEEGDTTHTWPSLCSCLLHIKYYRHCGYQNWTVLAGGSFRLKTFQQVKALQNHAQQSTLQLWRERASVSVVTKPDKAPEASQDSQ